MRGIGASTAARLIAEIERLAYELGRLREAEARAIRSKSKALPEIRRLHHATIQRISSLTRRIFRGWRRR